MPSEFNLIQRAELQQRLTRGLSIVGEKSPARTLDPTIQAVVLLEDLTGPGSPAEQPVDRRAYASWSQPAVVGELPLVVLLNPATSGLVVVVDHMWLTTSSSALDILVGRFDTAGIVLATPGNYADSRHGLDSPVQLWAGTNAVSAITQELMRIRISTGGAGDSQIDLPGVVLLPGETFGVEHTGANISLGFAPSWLEYVPS